MHWIAFVSPFPLHNKIVVTTGGSNPSTSGGNIVTSFTLSPDPDGSDKLIASYFQGGCTDAQTTSALTDQPSPDTPVSSETTATVTNDVLAVITAFNDNNGAGMVLPTSGGDGTTTYEATYCIRVTICSDTTATTTCPFASVVDFVEADITYSYTLDGTDIAITSISATENDPTTGNPSDEFAITAFVCDGSLNELTTATDLEIEVDTEFRICAQVTNADATSVQSITSFSLTPADNNPVTFTPGSGGVASTDCAPSDICSVTATMPPRFVLDSNGENPDTRSLTGTLTAVLVLDSGRRLVRQTIPIRNLQGEVSAGFSLKATPAEEKACSLDLTNLFTMSFWRCLWSRILSPIFGFARSAGGFLGF